jgi:hypothetical protein
MDLEAYRKSAETFLESLEREFYRHYAGLQEAFEIESIYSRHASLFSRGAVESLRQLRDRAAPGGEDRRRLSALLDFAAQGYVSDRSKSLEAELAQREATLQIDLGGERLGFRASTVAQANEPDGIRRALIERGRLGLIETELQPLHEELFERRQACALALGWSDYRELCADCKGLDLDGLHAQTEEFLARTSRLYPELLGPQLRSILEIEPGELRSSDLPRLFRAPIWDELFPGDRLVASFAQTMAGLGIDVRGQPGVTLDIDSRPNKSPRAFCAPVRTPGEVYLVIAPFGGRDDFEALFHEGGHTQHHAHVDAGLPFEFRYLGDNAITETYAFLFQHLVDNPSWLERHLGVEDPAGLAAYARAKRLVYLRRYAAKLSYELELQVRNGSSLATLRHRYSELLGSAVRTPWPGETFLADVDPGFYCTCYLRAWALEARLRAWLSEQFGADWFASPEAGAELRTLWRLGQRATPDELVDELGGGPLDFASLATEFGR